MVNLKAIYEELDQMLIQLDDQIERYTEELEDIAWTAKEERRKLTDEERTRVEQLADMLKENRRQQYDALTAIRPLQYYA